MNGRQTYLLTQGDVRSALPMKDALEAVESAFRAYGEGRTQMPPKPYLQFGDGDLRCMPAYDPQLGLAAVKNVNAHPHNRDLPTVMATVTLFDPQNGFPLAIMDGTYLTAMRTAAAGGVAVRCLARSDSRVVGIIGAGRQAGPQLQGLVEVMGSLEQALVCDLESDRAEALAAEARARYGLGARATSAQEAVSRADIVVTVTPVCQPVVMRSWVRPGTHLNAIGADAPGKQELESALLVGATVVVDNWEQASHGGEINVPLAEGFITREDIHADIGQVVAGKRPGRRSDDEITVFDSTGLAIQDLACAAHVYRRAVVHGQAGELRSVDFLGGE